MGAIWTRSTTTVAVAVVLELLEIEKILGRSKCKCDRCQEDWKASSASKNQTKICVACSIDGYFESNETIVLNKKETKQNSLLGRWGFTSAVWSKKIVTETIKKIMKENMSEMNKWQCWLITERWHE